MFFHLKQDGLIQGDGPRIIGQNSCNIYENSKFDLPTIKLCLYDILMYLVTDPYPSKISGSFQIV